MLKYAAVGGMMVLGMFLLVSDFLRATAKMEVLLRETTMARGAGRKN